ncbi:NAD(P)-binding protein [Trichoderma austrokoningii]
MMRIAVAGGRGFGFLLATELAQAANAYNVVVLSRSARPEFDQFDVQVHVVDYHDHNSLGFALQGVDLVISTISGTEQLNLIDASGRGRVRMFVPSEFEGSLSRRPSRNDPLDRGSSQALALLKQWSESSRMKYTVFSCGLFMERFHPCGIINTFGIGHGSGVGGPGEFLVNSGTGTAEYPEQDAKGHSVRVCLTSVYDLVRYMVAAVDLGPSHWPREFTMFGDRMKVRDLITTYSAACNVVFTRHVQQPAELEALLTYYAQLCDYDKVAYYQRLLATANGRYDFTQATLVEAVNRGSSVNIQPVTFGAWLTSIWQTF